MPIFHHTHTATAADTGQVAIVTVTRENDLTTAVVSDISGGDLSGSVVLQSSLPPPLRFTDPEATDLAISLAAAAHRGDPGLVEETLLRDWPGDVASEPLPELVDTDTAQAAIDVSRRFRGAKLYINGRDWWIGYYRSDTHHYVCPLPTVVLRWVRRVTGRSR